MRCQKVQLHFLLLTFFDNLNFENMLFSKILWQFNTKYNVERLALQTIYVLNKEILQFLGLKFALYNQDRFQIKSGW